jgi:rhodanese-related sulfurtransferase
MFSTLGVILIVLAGMSLLIIRRVKTQRSQRQMEQHSITADELYALLASGQEVLLFDVRQPLDLLAYPEIIPRAQRIPPNELHECPSDKTSRAVLRRAMSLHFLRVKFLKGGLASWKAKGYPVEPYKEVFHLYTPSAVAKSA